ncbi:aminoglycoside N(3)-acetyltransferase [Streptomyces sp. VRA16 Mangrove soil]|uniref:aminoglycoside N(3)-acetyltransferase n=1 Tax=Streptomyces sp. VRA16 Mangrove soil TaxID=2817434 RepID=UPI001A9E7156|nr:AAC(3) family N-acetyltransferase [Streptomyces sp. VRA16 Mangrove soil]MBO1335095.1 AAC(3) family N-acetyltransferase [Streptomyces sp. VRA16 Mangrove soil]
MSDATGRLPGLLRSLGVRRGGVLLVHAALGGTGLDAGAVRDALLDALGPGGTLVVPAFTPENSDTSTAHLKRVAHLSPAEQDAFRADMAPFDARRTPCPEMGALAECVRATPGAVRSTHPQTSFAALGTRAARLMAGHGLDCHLGERSPLAKLYAVDAQVLLLRAPFGSCTAFHLAEYRLDPAPGTRTYRCVVGERAGNWIAYEDLELDDSDFDRVGAGLAGDLVREGTLHGRSVRLFALRDAVEHARRNLAELRPWLT